MNEKPSFDDQSRVIKVFENATVGEPPSLSLSFCFVFLIIICDNFVVLQSFQTVRIGECVRKGRFDCISVF